MKGAEIKSRLTADELRRYDELAATCKANDMRVWVRSVNNKKFPKKEIEEFTIFLYNNDAPKRKNEHRYLVGYDGHYKGTRLNFASCLTMAEEFVKTYLSTGKDLKKTNDILFNRI